MPDSSADQLSVVREHLRDALRIASLRELSREIGISHTALAGFVREDSPRQPYGIGARKLLNWAAQKGLIPSPPWGFRQVRESFQDADSLVQAMTGGARMTDASLKRIREHLRTLSYAGLDEVRLHACEELLRGSPFMSLRSFGAPVTDADIITEVDRAFRFIREVLEEEGLRFEPDEEEQPPRPPTPTVDEAEEEAAIARQLPDPPAPAQKKEKRRA